MPTFTPLQQFQIDFRRADFSAFGTGRDPTHLHLGEIIRAKKAAAGDRIDGIEGEQENLRAQIGFLWERAVGMVWQGIPWAAALEIVWKEYCSVAQIGPPERGYVESQLRIEHDGIRMTPDGLDENGWLESYKFTYRTMRKWEEDAEGEFWSWLEAEAGYVYAINRLRTDPCPEGCGCEKTAPPLLGCRFFIFWANGDYSRKPGRGPQATYTEVRWTPEELESNWQGILRYRDYCLKLRKERVAA